MFSNRKLAKRLKQIGSNVVVKYTCVINNDGIVEFDSQSDMFNYIKEYRNNTAIFNLQLNRIEVYSL